jgi:hypothetical protein
VFRPRLCAAAARKWRDYTDGEGSIQILGSVTGRIAIDELKTKKISTTNFADFPGSGGRERGAAFRDVLTRQSSQSCISCPHFQSRGAI